jgi:hypothetical protein
MGYKWKGQWRILSYVLKFSLSKKKKQSPPELCEKKQECHSLSHSELLLFMAAP